MSSVFQSSTVVISGPCAVSLLPNKVQCRKEGEGNSTTNECISIKISNRGQKY